MGFQATPLSTGISPIDLYYLLFSAGLFLDETKNKCMPCKVCQGKAPLEKIDLEWGWRGGKEPQGQADPEGAEQIAWKAPDFCAPLGCPISDERWNELVLTLWTWGSWGSPFSPCAR